MLAQKRFSLDFVGHGLGVGTLNGSLNSDSHNFVMSGVNWKCFNIWIALSRFEHGSQRLGDDTPRSIHSEQTIVIMLGGPYAEILAPIYDEFMRWKELLKKEFQRYLAHKKD